MSRVDLVFAITPGISVWQTPLAPAMLAALLQEEGYKVAQLDGHIEGVEEVLRGKRPGEIDGALKTVRDPSLDIRKVKDLIRLNGARETIKLTSRSIPPFGHFEVASNHVSYLPPGRDHSFEWLESAIRDRGQNLFYPYLSRVMLPRIEELNPRVCGITIGHDTQLQTALVLGSMVKEALPGTRVVYGGNYLAQVQTIFKQPEFPGMFKFGDCYVYAEGFRPIQEVMRAVDQNLDFREVSGAVWMTGEKKVVINERTRHPYPFENIPTPLFVSMEQQWSPEPIYPLYTCSNCPYGCNFCAIAAGSDTYRCPPRVMNPRRVAEHVIGLIDQGARIFEFADESMPSAKLIAIGRELKKMGHGEQAIFAALMNAEECLADRKVCQALYDAGLRCAQIGIETISTASLRSQNKSGNKPLLYQRLIRNLADVGVQVHVFVIVGIPGEPVIDSLSTLAFLEQNGDALTTAVVSRFRVPKMSRAGLIGTGTDGIKVRKDSKPWSANLDFEYGDGKSGQQIDALRKLGRQVCIDLPLHHITSLLAEHANRIRWSLEDLRLAARVANGCLPSEEPIHHLDHETRKLAHAIGQSDTNIGYRDLLNQTQPQR